MSVGSHTGSLGNPKGAAPEVGPGEDVGAARSVLTQWAYPLGPSKVGGVVLGRI
jgi:hypothetical protein